MTHFPVKPDNGAFGKSKEERMSRLNRQDVDDTQVKISKLIARSITALTRGKSSVCTYDCEECLKCLLVHGRDHLSSELGVSPGKHEWRKQTRCLHAVYVKSKRPHGPVLQ